MQPFVHLSFVFWLHTVLQYQSSRLSNFLVFHTYGGVSSRPTAFLLFNFFVSTTLSSSWVNWPTLMSIYNFRNRFICNFRGFYKQILEMIFPHVYSFFLAGSFQFSYGGALPLILFIYCLPRYSRLSIFYWIYALISSICAFLCFWGLALVVFLLFHRDAVFLLSPCFLTVVSHGTSYLALNLLQKRNMPHYSKRY